jgi:hypothetical protein
MVARRKNASKNANTTRGRPFASGNPGRPKGARNRTTIAVEALLDGEAERLTRKAVELALAGDGTALRLCIDRIAPPRKGRTVAIKLPKVKTSADVIAALAAIVAAVGRGDITPDEALQLSAVVEIQRRAIETVDHETRLANIEQRMRKTDEQ